ncbi:hypothetical protein A0O34_14955 [Chryseobacterium glaciei]|uniref:Uncharacterized protein n=1 Tax=Chryseobacterium glaciei TaxID=1685010 RepID=A0A172XXY0_9FLAO|nr:hypothetical protein [Chryseobacterium glaciei]ANF51722.1 hypothetical protein A0O34_14955 [Chryseobacterium glaciei]
MNILEITKEAALKAHKEASPKGKILLENLFGGKVFLQKITDRIKSIDDAVGELGEDDPDVIHYLKLEASGINGHILYSQMLVVITKALNEEYTPDWNNGEWDKWYNWFNMSSSSSGRFSFGGSAARGSLSYCGSRLCFKSKELAQYAAKQFIDIYEKAFTI